MREGRQTPPDQTSRIVPVDLETAHIWGEVTARAAAQGRVVPVADGLVAATRSATGCTS